MDELISIMEEGRSVYDGYLRAYVETVDGDRYHFITFLSMGEKLEIESCPAFFLTKEAAINNFLLYFKEYSKDKEKKAIFWRKKPELHVGQILVDDLQIGRPVDIFNVCARFLISDVNLLTAEQMKDVL